MFDLVHIIIEDFKSYKGRHDFTFPLEHGLYKITGQNLANPRLGPNGVGKTSLIDAIKWCLYGSTTRSLKASDVVNWSAKSCNVTMELLIGNTAHTITRIQNPNNLTLNDVVVDQIALDKAIRLNQDSFIHSVVIPQFGTSFFDLQPAQKLTLFSDIMNLDHWLNKSLQAADLLQNVKREELKIENKISEKNGEIDSIKHDIDYLRQKVSTFDESSEEKIIELETKLSEAQTIKKTIRGKLNKLITNVDKIKDEIKVLIKDEITLSEERDSNLVNQKVMTLEIKSLQDQLTTTENDLSNLLKLGPVCSKCKQKVDPKHLKEHSSSFAITIVDLKNKLKTANKESMKLDSKTKEIYDALGELKSILSGKRDEQSTLEEQEQDTEFKKRVIDKDIKSISSSIAEETNRSNPFMLMLKDKKTNLKTSTELLNELKIKLDECKELENTLIYWVGGFKRIRLFVIEEAIKGLEIEINNSLTTLGLVDWQVTLDVERENKSGGVTKGFTVLITSPDNDKPTRFESWSGGETQRLRLAGDLGLSNLIMERAGLVNAIEFFDEPSEHMSKEGLEDLVETLHERAVASKRKIYLADHNVIESDLFSGVLLIIKDENGSHLKFE